MRNLPVAILIFSLMLFAQGCQTLDTVTNVGADIFASTGAISGEQADSIKRSSKALSQAFEEFTPENEY